MLEPCGRVAKIGIQLDNIISGDDMKSRKIVAEMFKLCSYEVVKQFSALMFV
jgi:hypothetical protein